VEHVPSGPTSHLESWPELIAILPMGFCFAGAGRSGDLPPRLEYAPAWHTQLLGQLRYLKLTLLIGQYVQASHLDQEDASLTETVKSWRAHWPSVIPLPQPSPRYNLWLRRNA
jgi:uracil-DNA glycosylase